MRPIRSKLPLGALSKTSIKEEIVINRLVKYIAIAAAAQLQPPSYAGTIPGTSIWYTPISTWGVTTPQQAGNNPLTLNYGNVVVKSSPGWGGAIFEYAVNGSGNLVNRHDAGRLWQSMVNIIEPDQVHFVNPTEGGDSYNRGSTLLQFENKITSPANVQYTKSAPFGFLNQQNEDNLGGTGPSAGNVVIQFNGMTIGKELTLAFNGDDNVSRYVTKIFANASANRISGALPILYLPGNFRHFTTYNAVSGNWLTQSVLPGQVNVGSQDYTACGGIMAENDERTVGVALYACRPGIHNGTSQNLAFSNYSNTGSSDPAHADTTALMSSIWYGDNIGLPAGESSWTTYIVVCKAPPPAGAACVGSMALLYSSGY